LLRKSGGKRPLERHTRRWEDNIIIELNGNRVGRCGLDASGSGKGPVAESYERGSEPWGSITGEEFFDETSDNFSKKDLVL
jgi:hypothetical protein